MERDDALGTGLVVLGIVLFAVPALFPVQSVLVHNTSPGTFGGPDQLEEEGIEIIAYENMSDRGQELYRDTLEAGGEYRVQSGDGAPEFSYPTAGERTDARRERPDRRPGVVAIERPEDGDLPRADEPIDRGPADGEGAEQRRQQAQRYDLMQTGTEPPPLGSTPQLLRLVAALLAVVSVGLGGYLRASN